MQKVFSASHQWKESQMKGDLALAAFSDIATHTSHEREREREGERERERRQ